MVRAVRRGARRRGVGEPGLVSHAPRVLRGRQDRFHDRAGRGARNSAAVRPPDPRADRQGRRCDESRCGRTIERGASRLTRLRSVCQRVLCRRADGGEDARARRTDQGEAARVRSQTAALRDDRVGPRRPLRRHGRCPVKRRRLSALGRPRRASGARRMLERHVDRERSERAGRLGCVVRDLQSPARAAVGFEPFAHDAAVAEVHRILDGGRGQVV